MKPAQPSTALTLTQNYPGDACDPQSASCIDRSYCEPATSKCTAPKADGAACTESQECAK